MSLPERTMALLHPNGGIPGHVLALDARVEAVKVTDFRP